MLPSSDVHVIGTSDVIATVEDLEVLSDGTVWVLNSLEPFFVGFAPDGEVLHVHGSQGGGPEEFRAPTAFVSGGIAPPISAAPVFKAGIAGDGAYNRTLTPDGFQAERRSIWEAPQTYIEMSPFFKADQINTPLLMYHGGDDNNTGTFPIRSERMIQALTALGKEAVLYVYPYESHTPRAIENKLDMWARFIEWFDKYVKNQGEVPVLQ